MFPLTADGLDLALLVGGVLASLPIAVVVWRAFQALSDAQLDAIARDGEVELPTPMVWR